MESFAKKMKMSINDKLIGAFDAQKFNNRPVKVDFTLKVDKFSSFSKNSIEKYVSVPFRSGNYHWELVFYPGGNVKEDGKNHISIYLRLSNFNYLKVGQQIIARFRIFLFDYEKHKFFTSNDGDLGQTGHFNSENRERGYAKFIPLTTFEDEQNGYLVNDECSFGVEVFVHKYNLNINNLKMMDDPVCSNHTWDIKNYSLLKSDGRLSDTEDGFPFLLSPLLSVGDYNCRIQFFPEGNAKNDKFTSLFLEFEDSGNLQVYAKCIIRVKAQSSDKHFQKEVTGCCVAPHGWQEFMEIGVLTHPTRDFLVNDTVTIEAQFTVYGTVLMMQEKIYERALPLPSLNMSLSV